MRGIGDVIIRHGRRWKERRRVVCGRRRGCWRIDWSCPFEETVVIRGSLHHKSGKLECEVLGGEDVVVRETENLECLQRRRLSVVGCLSSGSGQRCGWLTKNWVISHLKNCNPSWSRTGNAGQATDPGAIPILVGWPNTRTKQHSIWSLTTSSRRAGRRTAFAAHALARAPTYGSVERPYAAGKSPRRRWVFPLWESDRQQPPTSSS